MQSVLSWKRHSPTAWWHFCPTQSAAAEASDQNGREQAARAATWAAGTGTVGRVMVEICWNTWIDTSLQKWWIHSHQDPSQNGDGSCHVYNYVSSRMQVKWMVVPEDLRRIVAKWDGTFFCIKTLSIFCDWMMLWVARLKRFEGDYQRVSVLCDVIFLRWLEGIWMN